MRGSSDFDLTLADFCTDFCYFLLILDFSLFSIKESEMSQIIVQTVKIMLHF